MGHRSLSVEYNAALVRDNSYIQQSGVRRLWVMFEATDETRERCSKLVISCNPGVLISIKVVGGEGVRNT